jgi:hypothetical protein
MAFSISSLLNLFPTFDKKTCSPSASGEKNWTSTRQNGVFEEFSVQNPPTGLTFDHLRREIKGGKMNLYKDTSVQYSLF